MTAPLTPITDEIIDQIASADDQHIATDFFRRLCNQAKEANRLREDAERFSREADNLARMLRRGQWLAKKETGDTGLKVWAGQAYDLLDKYGRLGSPLRGEDAAIDAERKRHDLR